MATVIDAEQGSDGVFRSPLDPDAIADRVKRGVGAVEEFVEAGRTVRNAVDLLRAHIRGLGRVPNPSRSRRKRNPEPVPVVDAEEI